MILQNKVILITGASRGLGRQAALAFVAQGAKLALLARNKKDLEKVREEIVNGGGVAGIYLADVTSKNQMAKAIKKILVDFGTIDILINNAGVYTEGMTEDIPPSEVEKVLAVNVLGVIFTTQAVLPIFRAKGKGLIINISSTSGKFGRPNQSVYCASKWAVAGFTESLKKELRGTNIKVVGFYPGGIKTNLFVGLPGKDISQFMEPKDVAEILVFLASRPESLLIDDIKIERTRR